MTEKDFIKSIMYLKSYYNNFDFDLKDELKIKIWYNDFKTFDELSMQNIVRLYTSVSKNPPNSPHDLIEPLNKMYQDKQLDEEEAWTKYREIESIKGGLYYCREKVYKALEEYPLIYKVVKELENMLVGRLESDTFLIKDFKKYYKELKQRYVKHDTLLSIKNNQLLETKRENIILLEDLK